MEWNIDNIDNIVQEINTKLVQGMTMTDIERNEFNVNPRVIHKRLERQGYRKINNQYSKSIENTKNIIRQEVGQNVGLPNGVIILKELEHKKFVGLLDRYEEIIGLLDMMNSTNKPNENKSIVLELPIEEGKKDFKATARINKIAWERFNIFCGKNKQYSKKDLLSQALLEYIDNHKE